MEPPNELSWTIWAAASPYSPLNLHHLPQPIPADAPLELQAGVFTFEDAFEDLLAVSAGRRLVDINTKYETRKMLRQMFPDGEDAAFWVRRLQSQNLLDNANFFPFQPRPFWPQDLWDSIHHEFARAADEARRAEERWLSHFGGRRDGDNREGEEGERDKDRPRLSLFDELERIFRSFEDGVKGEDTEGKKKGDKKEGEKKEVEKKKKKEEEADTFEDLYSSVQSTFSSGARSLGTLVKMARDGVADFEKSQSSHTEQRDQKSERKETTEEYTDEDGSLHEKRTVQILDGEGREIGREVHVRITSPHLRPKQEQQQQQQDDDTQLEGGGPRRKPDGENTKDSKDGKGPSGDNSGWFWK